MASKQGRKAWLVTWVTANQQHLQSPIAAMFSSRKSPDTVKDSVEFLYLTTQFGGDEQLAFLTDPSSNPYPATYGTIRVNVSGTGETNVSCRLRSCAATTRIYTHAVWKIYAWGRARILTVLSNCSGMRFLDPLNR